MTLFKEKQSLPVVYVLMRTYAPSILSTDFFERWKPSLQSVYSNKAEYEAHGGRLVLLINDDTKRQDLGSYRFYLIALHKALHDVGFEEQDYILVETNGKGSSYATYNIRKAFLDASKHDDKAIAITLDQDDILKPKAARRIAARMKENGIVISPFEIRDDNNLDITDDGGRRHNLLARRATWPWVRRRFSKIQEFIPRNRYNKVQFPSSIYLVGDSFACIGQNICLFLKRERLLYKRRNIWKKNLYSFSSIGWTKSFSREVLEKFHEDLTSFLDMERGGAGLFFEEHHAYEDFIDFYCLLYSDINIRGALHKSHTYIKHKSSITSSPTVEDFSNHRTATLIALIDMCYANEGACLPGCDKKKLREDFEYKLLRFVSSKVYQIDHIISKYRDEYIRKGNDTFADFSAKTHDGYIISKLSRLALGDNRKSEQDTLLFRYKTGRGDNSRSNFERLFSNEHINAVPEYRIMTFNTVPRFALRKCVLEEQRLAGDVNSANADEVELNKLYGKNLPPNQKRLRSIRRLIAIWFIILACLAGTVFLLFKESIEHYQQLLVGIISIWLAVLTYLLTESGKVKTMAREESSLQKLYYSEFIDFIRHLEANLKVMIQIRKRLLETDKPQSVDPIHFTNLKWPDSSCLFSDHMAKIISRDRVDEFSRLKVNLRNINNSSDWLRTGNNTGKILVSELEWEIARHFGYLLNMYYLRDNNFSFASQNELDLFINENAIKHKLSDLFMDYPSNERVKQVDFFINMYYDDRRMRRSVLVF